MQSFIEPVKIDNFLSRSVSLDHWKGKDGPFIRGFLLNTKRNKNGWRVTKDAIMIDMADFINHPGVYYEKNGETDHTEGSTYKEMMSSQELYRVTNIIDFVWNEETETLDYIAEFVDGSFQKKWDDGKINDTSPAIWPIKMDRVGTMENGMPMLDVHRFRALHNAYLDKPAYGPDAHTVGMCESDAETCKLRLKAGIDTDLAPLQEISLIRNTLNKVYTPCEIKRFHSEFMNESDSCVARQLKAVVQDNPEKDTVSQLSMAYALCKNDGIKMIEEISDK